MHWKVQFKPKGTYLSQLSPQLSRRPLSGPPIEPERIATMEMLPRGLKHFLNYNNRNDNSPNDNNGNNANGNPPEKGLENARGQNNCFLNVVIQGLYHLEAFRKAFSMCELHYHNNTQSSSATSNPETCIFCALNVSRYPLSPICYS